MKTKRIGYIDHRLDNFHANIYLDLLRGDLKARGWEVAKCWALDEAGGRQWAARKNVSYVSTVADMADCDALVVLAPSTPEVHLELAKLAFPLRKPTYVDKTFAPDLKTAKRIFALADKHRVPVITSSALRCAASLNRTVTELGRDRIRHLRQEWALDAHAMREAPRPPDQHPGDVLTPGGARVDAVGDQEGRAARVVGDHPIGDNMLPPEGVVVAEDFLRRVHDVGEKVGIIVGLRLL